jgi:Phage derived protein Gp49-like (DUF891)
MYSSLWDIRCYLDDDGIDVIDSWYRAQPERLQAKFDTKVRYLRAQPRERWVRPYFDQLKGPCKGLCEIRFEFNNVQYRPIGIFSGKMEFTLVLVAAKNGKRFDPSNTCHLGNRRKLEIESNRSKSHECDME